MNQKILSLTSSLVIAIISPNWALAQTQENTVVQQSGAQNFQRIRITSKIDKNIEIIYGCLKSTGRQSENISSLVSADNFFDIGPIQSSIWRFLPGGIRGNLRKLELVKDDAYCAMVVGRKRTKRGFVAYRISREWTGNLVIMTYDKAGNKNKVLTSTLFCPKIRSQRICYKIAPSGVKFQDGKFWYKGQELADNDSVINGVAGCFSLTNKKNGVRHSLVAFIGNVPESIKNQVDINNKWRSISDKSCYDRGFRVEE